MRKIVFIIAAFCFIIFMVVVFVSLSLFRRPPGGTPQVTLPTSIPLPTRPYVTPVLQYNTQKADQLVESSQNRQVLSPNGIAAKERLIAEAGGSATIYTSPTLTIDYLEAPDLFQAEIRTENIAAAKQEGVDWMISQGFTASDLCRLPFSYYLSPPIRSSLEGRTIVFNPLPEGC